MNTSEFLRAVDHAAGMNDRWLFLAAFCLLLLLCGVVIHWLVGHLQAVLSDYKTSRESHQVALEKIISTQNETALKLSDFADVKGASVSATCRNRSGLRRARLLAQRQP